MAKKRKGSKKGCSKKSSKIKCARIRQRDDDKKKHTSSSHHKTISSTTATVGYMGNSSDFQYDYPFKSINIYVCRS